MFDLTMLVPSRSRPDSIVRLRDEWNATIRGNSRLLVLIDDDDPNLDEYLAIPGVEILVGPRMRLSPMLDHYGPLEAENCFAIGFMGDDHSPKTEGWDVRFVEALKELGTGIVYGNDLYHGAGLPTAAAMTSDIVRTLGYMSLPGAIHLFVDNFWLTLGQHLGKIIYLDDVVLEHLHPVYGKSTWDESYKENNSKPVWDNDEAAYNAYVENRLMDDVEKLWRLL